MSDLVTEILGYIALSAVVGLASAWWLFWATADEEGRAPFLRGVQRPPM